MTINVTPQPLIPEISLTNFQKGHAFEDFIITLFNERRFKLLEWRSDKRATNGVFPLSNIFPDLEFAFMGWRSRRFAVECKWRKSFNEGKIYWASLYQIINYVRFQSESNIPVFVAIGIGGEPKNPEKLFVTPLNNIKGFPEVYESQLIPYKRETKRQFYFNTYQLELF